MEDSTSSFKLPMFVPFEGLSLDIVHPCMDYGFKRAFHASEVACGFLNTILNLSGEEAINAVRFLDEEFPIHQPIGHDFIDDILCETGTGRRFLIEMQNDFRADYATKALTEFCRLIAHWDSQVIHREGIESARKRARASTTYEGVKEFWKDVKTAIVVVITNKRFPAAQKKELFPAHTVMEPDIINTYRMVHENGSGRPLGDLDARVVLVMLGNFSKKENELTSSLDHWLYAFKDEALASGVTRILAYKHIENIHHVGVDSDTALKSFCNVLSRQVLKMAGELERYEKNIVEVNGILANMEETKFLEGIEKGKAKITRGLAIKWIKKHKPDGEIIEDLDITLEELQTIKGSME